jgi:hypothetical protein
MPRQVSSFTINFWLQYELAERPAAQVRMQKFYRESPELRTSTAITTAQATASRTIQVTASPLAARPPRLQHQRVMRGSFPPFRMNWYTSS